MKSKTCNGIGLAIAVLALAGCGSSATPAGTSAARASSAPPSVTATPVVQTAPPVVQSNGDLGATLAQFKAANGADSGPGALCTAANSCFGPSLTNDESDATYEFVNVSVYGGIVDGYQQNFLHGTTSDDAKAEILRWLPTDTRTTSFVIDHNGGSCALWNVSSATLAKVLSNPATGDPQGALGIELSYTDANLNLTYDPNNVEDASISVAPNSASDNC